jgi:carbamoyltransferase
MGLAPYGEPAFLPQMRGIVRLCEGGGFELDLAYFRHATEKVDYEWDGGAPVVGTLYAQALVELLGPARGAAEELTQRHRDLARSPFRRLYVQAAAGDAGGAIGAALVAWQRVRNGAGAARSPMVHAYYGPEFTDAEIGAAISARADELQRQACVCSVVKNEKDLIGKTADAIAGGSVVGWFQGRMEWGPRALGNRSIVCDPRRADMKELLNAKIKRRESFRPFAPSILREAVAEWFETDDDVPFMMQVYQIREAQRARIPAVTHVDGSGRLQTVTRESNPRYYALIEAFRALTGVPMVLNTSFNENEPVVCRPEEALDCFLRTQMDVLVMGNWYVER